MATGAGYGRAAAAGRGAFLLLLVGVLAAAFFLTAAPRAEATFAKCADVMFVGARGSGELEQAKTDGMGVPVDHMGKRLEKLVLREGETFAFRQVPYGADSVLELVPSKVEVTAIKGIGAAGLGNPAAGVAGLTGAVAVYYARHARPYLKSIAEGVASTISRVKQLDANCPETELVLAGYSQGAMAVHQAELQLEREGDEEALDMIGGTLLLGDGDRVPDTQAKIFGGAPRVARAYRSISTERRSETSPNPKPPPRSASRATSSATSASTPTRRSTWRAPSPTAHTKTCRSRSTSTTPSIGSRRNWA